MIFFTLRSFRNRMAIVLFLAGLHLSFSGCSSDSKQPNTNEKQVEENAEPLFPFHEFIQTELAYLEATPFAIVKYISEDNKMPDSSLLSVEDVREIANEFTVVNPNENQWRKHFEENSFVDITLGYNTFVITALKPDVPLRQATILVHPETNQVERLVLETVENDMVQKRLTWKKHESLQIVELFASDHVPQTRITRVVWNDQ